MEKIDNIISSKDSKVIGLTITGNGRIFVNFSCCKNLKTAYTSLSDNSSY